MMSHKETTTDIPDAKLASLGGLDSANFIMSHSKIIIGLAGKRGSGKSTAARYLCEKYGFVEVAFADPIKEIAEVLGFDGVRGDLYEKEKVNSRWQVSAREFMQKFGTEVMRETLPVYIPTMSNVWIKLAKGRILDCKSDRIVVSDVRFIDELKMLTGIGARCYNIHRTRPTALIAGPSTCSAASAMSVSDHDAIANHSSEQSLPIDDVIVNDTYSNLYTRLDVILKECGLLSADRMADSIITDIDTDLSDIDTEHIAASNIADHSTQSNTPCNDSVKPNNVADVTNVASVTGVANNDMVNATGSDGEVDDSDITPTEIECPCCGVDEDDNGDNDDVSAAEYRSMSIGETGFYSFMLGVVSAAIFALIFVR